MGWLRGKKNDKPEYTGLQLQTAASFLPIPIVWGTNKVAHNVIFYDNFQSHQGGSKTGKGGHGGGGGGGSSAQQTTTYTCDLALGICEGPIQRLRARLEGAGRIRRAVRLVDVRLQRHDAAGGVGLFLGALSRRPAQFPRHRGCRRGRRAARGRRGPRQHLLGNLRRPLRERRERDRRRPRRGHLRFPDQRPIWRGLRRVADRLQFAVRGQRRLAILPRHGDLDLADAHRSRAGVVDPHPLAPDRQLRGGVERRRAALRALRRHGDRARPRQDDHGADGHPAGRGDRLRHVDLDRRHLHHDRAQPAGRRSANRQRSIRDRVLPGLYARSRPGDSAVSGLFRRHRQHAFLLQRRRRKGDHRHLYLHHGLRLHAGPDAGLFADRRRFRRRGGRGSGPGRLHARRPVLALDDRAARLHVARQPLRADHGRGARPEPDRALRAARRLVDPGARNLRRAQRRAALRPIDPSAATLHPRQLQVQSRLDVLPARPDGRHRDHRRQSRARGRGRARDRDRGGRQGPVRDHGRGIARRRRRYAALCVRDDQDAGGQPRGVGRGGQRAGHLRAAVRLFEHRGSAARRVVFARQRQGRPELGRGERLGLARRLVLRADRLDWRRHAAGLLDGLSGERERLGHHEHAFGRPDGERGNADRNDAGRRAGRRDALPDRQRADRLRDGDADRAAQVQSDRACARAVRHVGDGARDRGAVRAPRHDRAGHHLSAPDAVDRRDALPQISVVQPVRRLRAGPLRLHALRPRRHRAGRPRPDRRATPDRDAARPRPDRRHGDARATISALCSFRPNRSSTSATSPPSAIRSRRRLEAALETLPVGSVDFGTITGSVTLSDDFGSVVDPPLDNLKLGTVP